MSKSVRYKRIPEYRGYGICDDGRVYCLETKKFLETWPDKKGIECILLPTGDFSKTPIHRLVARAFVENPANGNTVYHIDGDKRNNHWTNLRWSGDKRSEVPTPRAWVERSGENASRAKLKEAEVIDIKLRLAVEENLDVFKELAGKYGVTTSAIYNIAKNKSWKHVSIEGLHNPYLTTKEESQ